MSKAARVPSFEPLGTPLSVLIDFDGTISLVDVGDALLAHLVVDQAEVARQDELYVQGRLGSRELIRWDMEMLPRDANLLLGEVERISLDDSFVDLVSRVRAVGGEIEIVSDGVGFHIEELLAPLGLSDLPVATNVSTLGRGADGVSFPYGHPACFVCGTCKRERVRVHQAADRVVVFVGDGTSDRYAAHHADIVFAKASLASWCVSEGLDFVPWERLADVAQWIEAALVDGRLPRSAADYAPWAAGRSTKPVPFSCGPEVWGDGRTTPPLPEPGITGARRT